LFLCRKEKNEVVAVEKVYLHRKKKKIGLEDEKRERSEMKEKIIMVEDK